MGINLKSDQIFFVTNNLYILHQNIAGLINKQDLLTVYLDDLEDKGKPVDVICITEHFVQEGLENMINIPNFRLAACFSRNKSRGGSCILIRSGIEYKILPEYNKKSICNIIECCAIELTEQNAVIVCIYRVPPQIRKKEKFTIFYEKLEEILNITLRYKNKKNVICGDFNINILDRNKQSLDFEDLLCQYNLKLEIHQPTRLQSKSCLDNFAHNQNSRNCSAEVLDYGLSDHTAQLFKLPIKKTCYIKSWYIERRDYCKGNLDKFKKYLSDLPFSEIYDTDDPNTAFDSFFELFSCIYNSCFPTKLIKLSSKRRPKWISSGIKLCSKKQRIMLWELRKSPNKTNQLNFKIYSKRLKKIIKLTQKAQNNYNIENSDNKSKATWQTINRTKTNLPREPISKIVTNDTIITEPQYIANAFNDFFIQEIEKNSQPTQDIKLDLESPINSLFIRPTNTNDIIKIIKSLKNKKSVGYDGICTCVLKYVAEEIAGHLSHIINLSINKGIFPDKLKISVIKPVFKNKNDKENMQYYRPVALVPIFSKIFEKVIYKSLSSFLEKQHVLVKEQNGFRRGKGINHAIFDFLSQVMRAMDKRIPICAIYMDMTKAFDFVNHDILLLKLKHYGVRGNTLNLLRSYLKNRRQYTEVSALCKDKNILKTFKSQERNTSYGVPQGSIMGPLLFLIYINDMPSNVKTPMTLFADDSTAIIKCNDLTQYENDINSILHDIINWMTKNNLIANINKTKLMQFYQRTSKPKLNIKYNSEQIEDVEVTKFLGLTIDNKLSWKQHADELCKKINKFAYALYKLSKIVSRKTVIIAYHGYVYSILSYGILFWGNCSERERIFKAQKRCIRAFNGLKCSDSCQPLFKSLNILTLPSIYIFEMAIFVKNNPDFFTKFSQQRDRNLRHGDRLCQQSFKTALLSKSFLNLAPNIYNKLPSDLKAYKLPLFKSKLKQLLVNKCYYKLTDFLNDNI